MYHREAVPCTFNSRNAIVHSIFGEVYLVHRAVKIPICILAKNWWTGGMQNIIWGPFPLQESFINPVLAKKQNWIPLLKQAWALIFIFWDVLFKASRITYRGCHFSMMSFTFLKKILNYWYIRKTSFGGIFASWISYSFKSFSLIFIGCPFYSQCCPENAKKN